MAATTQPGAPEVAILARAFADESGKLPRDPARQLLKPSLPGTDRSRMHALAVRNQAGAFPTRRRKNSSPTPGPALSSPS